MAGRKKQVTEERRSRAGRRGKEHTRGGGVNKIKFAE